MILTVGLRKSYEVPFRSGIFRKKVAEKIPYWWKRVLEVNPGSYKKGKVQFGDHTLPSVYCPCSLEILTSVRADSRVPLG